MTHAAVEYGPRLVGTPTGTLRSAVLVRPSQRIELATPRDGEPGAVFTRAVEQHEVLGRTLRSLGVDVSVVEPYSDDPDAVTVAEAAVTFENGVVLMRPSSMTRRAEPEHMSAQLVAMDVPLAGYVAPPGLLDGTDVLLIGRTAFIGVGARGNAIGRAGFVGIAQAHGYRVIEVVLAPGVESLQSVAGAVASDTLVVAAHLVDMEAFTGFQTIALDRGEDSAAGVLCIGERHVVASVRYRTSLQRLRRAGVTVEGIDLYEFEKVGITPSMLVLPLRRD